MKRRSLFVNARFLTQEITGVQRHAIEVSKRIKAWYPDARFIAPRRVRNQDLADALEVEHIGRFSGHAWEQTELLPYAIGGSLVNLCNTAPIFHPRQLVTLHDAAVFAFPNAFSPPFRATYVTLFHALKHSARVIVTDSYFSQAELSHYLGIRKERIEVVYLGSEHSREAAPETGILERYDLREKPYLLAVGSASPHKNFARLVRALVSLGEQPIRIILAGGANPRVHSPTGELPNSAVHVGYVSDGELRSLYEHAAGYIHPAYYEGFGLPPLEAMALGAPVLCSRAASLPEVCGDAALYFDPFDEADIADKIRTFIEHPTLRRDLREKGKIQAQMFRWDKTAKTIFELATAHL